MINLPTLVVVALLMCSVGIGGYCCFKFIQNKYKKEIDIVITNALCVFIAIEEYQFKQARDPHPSLKKAYWNEIELGHDIKNLHELFGSAHLNYEIYPKYDDKQYPKAHWTLREIISLLKSKAEQFHTNRDKYDALIV
eukprot:236768_1